MITRRSLWAGMLCAAQLIALCHTWETKFQLPHDLLVHMLEMETQYGTILGTKPVVETLPAQRTFLNTIARRLQVDPSVFVGSSGGAMGVMQIQPATFYQYGQDGNGDGKKDPRTPEDSIATAAYYLARLIATRGLSRALTAYSGHHPTYARKILANLQ